MAVSYLDREPPGRSGHRFADTGLDAVCKIIVRHKGVAKYLRLSHVVRRVDEQLELEVGHLVDVQIKTLEFYLPRRHFAVSYKNL
jgi:hypothetical protein